MCCLGHSDLHVRALDNLDWRSTSLHQAHVVLSLDAWETSTVFCRRRGGGLGLGLDDHPAKTEFTLLVSKSTTEQNNTELT